MDSLKIESTDTYSYNDPNVSRPPLGTKLLLLTVNRTAVIGQWTDIGYIAWQYLPKVPKHMREF